MASIKAFVCKIIEAVKMVVVKSTYVFIFCPEAWNFFRRAGSYSHSHLYETGTIVDVRLSDFVRPLQESLPHRAADAVGGPLSAERSVQVDVHGGKRSKLAEN